MAIITWKELVQSRDFADGDGLIPDSKTNTLALDAVLGRKDTRTIAIPLMMSCPHPRQATDLNGSPVMDPD